MLTKLFVKGQILLNDLKNDQRGVTAIEYAVVAVAITGVVVAAFGGTSGTTPTGLSKAINDALAEVSKKLGTLNP